VDNSTVEFNKSVVWECLVGCSERSRGDVVHDRLVDDGSEGEVEELVEVWTAESERERERDAPRANGME
jgi:hypothetical protein